MVQALVLPLERRYLRQPVDRQEDYARGARNLLITARPKDYATLHSEVWQWIIPVGVAVQMSIPHPSLENPYGRLR